MPIPVIFPCDVNTLLRNAKCFKQPCMAEEDREALEIYVRIQALKAAGGKDYTGSAGLRQLQIDGKDYQTLFPEQLKAIELYMDMINALNNGAGFSQKVNDMERASTCYECLGHMQKKRLMTYLKCLLNQIDQPE